MQAAHEISRPQKPVTIKAANVMSLTHDDQNWITEQLRALERVLLAEFQKSADPFEADLDKYEEPWA